MKFFVISTNIVKYPSGSKGVYSVVVVCGDTRISMTLVEDFGLLYIRVDGVLGKELAIGFTEAFGSMVIFGVNFGKGIGVLVGIGVREIIGLTVGKGVGAGITEGSGN